MTVWKLTVCSKNQFIVLETAFSYCMISQIKGVCFFTVFCFCTKLTVISNFCKFELETLFRTKGLILYKLLIEVFTKPQLDKEEDEREEVFWIEYKWTFRCYTVVTISCNSKKISMPFLWIFTRPFVCNGCSLCIVFKVSDLSLLTFFAFIMNFHF